MVPSPVAAYIDGVRRSLGVADIGRLAPHLTLVPPLNVPTDSYDDAVALLGWAAKLTRPITVDLGPPATFLPTNPVLYLEVGGDVADVDHLRGRVFRPPLERSLTWPFQPHVTLVDGGDPEHLRDAAELLRGWREQVTFTTVTLLEEQRHPDDNTRIWRPIAESPFTAG